MRNIPPIVLIGGALCDHKLWDPMRRSLPNLSCRMLVLNYSDFRSAKQAARSLLPTLPDHFALAGFSLGGVLALELQAQAPERIAGMMLIATNARADTDSKAHSRRLAVEAAEREGIVAYVQRVLWPISISHSKVRHERLRDIFCSMARQAGLDTFDRQTDIALLREDSLPRLSSVRVPTVIISGGEDFLNPSGSQVEMVEGIVGARWVILPGVGHLIPLEAPDTLAIALREWVVNL